MKILTSSFVAFIHMELKYNIVHTTKSNVHINENEQ